MARLTLEQITRENRNREAGAITSVNLSHRALSDVSCLATFQSLERLDLSGNCLSTLEGLSSCVNLRWLSVVENKLESLKGIEGLSKLTVLNAGKNKLRTMNEISSVTSLQALILNDNNISSICKLDRLKYLNTLVLSRNLIHDIGDALVKVESITKLSLSHCQIELIGSSLMSCTDLKEARFSHNNIIVLSALHNLRNLNVRGNPIAEKDKLVKKVKKLVPNLQIFNSKPVEKSNMREKISIKDTLIHTKDVVEEDVKGKKSKLDAKVSGKSLLKKSSEEVHALPTLSKVEVEKKAKEKSEIVADVQKRNMSIQKKGDNSTQNDKDKRLVKKSKRKPENEESKFEGIDDGESPFMDLILSDKTLEDYYRKEENRQVAPDAKFPGGLVINHTRKKAAKSESTGNMALQLLPPMPEVGMGGPSTWDD